MKMRIPVALALTLGLAAAPAEAGLFGKKSAKKDLPKATTAEERMGHYEVAPASSKPAKKQKTHAGNRHIRRQQAQPIFISHPWVRGQR